MRVLPLASRCAFEMYGLKNSNRDWSAYCQTMVFVRGSTSMTRENVAGWSRRCVPLSKIRRLPLSSGRGSCCWASGGLPSCHTIFPVARVPDFPQDLAVLVDFEDRAALEAWPCLEAVEIDHAHV